MIKLKISDGFLNIGTRRRKHEFIQQLLNIDLLDSNADYCEGSENRNSVGREAESLSVTKGLDDKCYS